MKDKAKTESSSKSPASNITVQGYKGLTEDMKCRGLKYEIGVPVIHKGELVLCRSGLHFCTDPMDVIVYYCGTEMDYTKTSTLGEVMLPKEVLYTKVVASDILHDPFISNYPVSKKVSKVLEVTKVLPLQEFIKTIVDETERNVRLSIPPERHNDSYSAHQVLVSTNRKHILQTVDAFTIALNRGIKSYSLTREPSSIAYCESRQSFAITEGQHSIAGTFGHSSKAITTGDSSAAKAEGIGSIAMSIGSNSTVSVGRSSKALALGYNNTARGDIGSWLVLVEYAKAQDIQPKHMKAVYVDGTKIKANVPYILRNNRVIRAGKL